VAEPSIDPDRFNFNIIRTKKLAPTFLSFTESIMVEISFELGTGIKDG
jgi:hypothetical protein